MTASSRDPDGAWHGVDQDRYRTRGADVFCEPSYGWFARCGKRVRGPLSSLGAAMEAAEKMTAERETA